ncbi:MAG: glycosyltransferase family 2 protein [Thermodesulfobacteriota bacterium]
MQEISAYIIAYNEAEKIRDAINSVLWADEIVVVDSFSQDDTARIAEAMGARVVQVAFHGFGDLRNQAMAACRFGWIFSLDADERCTAEARDEMLAIVRADGPADAYYVPRRNFFMGRWINHSGFYPDYRQPQLFRQGALHFLPDPVHERFEILSGKPVGYLQKAIWQKPYKSFAEIQHKASRYSTLGAQKLLAAGRRGSMAAALAHACWTFFQIYVLKRGFLDGWAGFVIAFGNFEGTFYKYAKLCESRAGWREPETLPLRRGAG